MNNYQENANMFEWNKIQAGYELVRDGIVDKCTVGIVTIYRVKNIVRIDINPNK